MPAPTGEITLRLAAARLGATNSLAVDGTIVFLGAGTHLLAVDAHNPASPQVIAEGPEFPGVVHAVVIRDKVAYVAAGASLVTADISNPANITLTGSVGLPGVPLVLALREMVLFAGGFIPAHGASNAIAKSGGMVATVDVSDSHTPSLMDHVVLKRPVGALALVGSALFADGTRVDASDPARLGKPQTRVLDFTSDPSGTLTVLGDTLLVGQEHVVNALDISDPAHPSTKFSASPPGEPEAPPVDGVPLAVSVDGANMYVLAAYEGSENLNAFAMPQVLTGTTDFTTSTRLIRSRDMLYLAQHGLMIFQAQVPLQAPVGVLNSDTVGDVAISPDAGYVMAPGSNFFMRLAGSGFTAGTGRIVSLGLPDLNSLGEYAPDDSGILNSISLSEGKLFLDEAVNAPSPTAIGLRELDISHPASMRLVQSYGAADGLPLTATYASAVKPPVVINHHTIRWFQNSQGQLGYKVFDLTTPGASPIEALTPDIMTIETASGPFVFATRANDHPLLLINTSDWTVSDKQVDISGNIVDVAAGDGYALVATDNELILVSTMDSGNPHVVDRMALPDGAFDIAIEGDHAFITTRGDPSSGQLYAFIVDKDHFRPAAVVTLPEGSARLAAAPGWVMVGGPNMGVWLLKVQP